MRQYVIKSTNNRIQLVFSNFRRDNLESFDVEIKGLNICGKTRALLEANGSPVAFFRYLAEHWNGWKGTKTWNSSEKELTLEVTRDSTGHLKLIVSILNGGLYDWKLSGILELEAGQLEEIARQIKVFFQEGGS